MSEKPKPLLSAADLIAAIDELIEESGLIHWRAIPIEYIRDAIVSAVNGEAGLREALRPFASICELADRQPDGRFPEAVMLELKDCVDDDGVNWFFRARAVLEES